MQTFKIYTIQHSLKFKILTFNTKQTTSKITHYVINKTIKNHIQNQIQKPEIIIK